jgi:outer membrane lipoprotein-sorting protein
MSYAQTDINALLEKIQKKHNDITSFEADFIQITTNDAFPDPLEQSGHLFAMRPKMIRWDFMVPMVQSYYTDGASITVWNEQNNQVLISNDMGDANDAFDVLTDFSSIQKKYNLTIKEETEKAYTFSVLPKEDQQFEKLEITMNKEELWITEFVVKSKETGTVQLNFSNIKRNSITDKGVFSFVPPDGAEIIRP